jgi:RNA polymerase sigma factor (sigma-70 family)
MPTFSLDARAEELLVVRCQLGERDAFDSLIRRWHEPVWRYLRRMSGSDDAAGDLAQDTWLRVMRGVVNLRDAASFRAWLFGIARRVAMDRFRREYSRESENTVNLEELPAPADDSGLESDLAALESGLASLPARERETLALFYLRELSLEEIAGLLAIPVGTVKSRLFRARQLLRNQLAGDRS